jgi:hypothetical protein
MVHSPFCQLSCNNFLSGMCAAFRGWSCALCGGLLVVQPVHAVTSAASGMSSLKLQSVAELMTACVQKLGVAGLKVVGQLPAAAELDQQCGETLAREVLTDRRRSKYWRQQMLRALLEQPAVQHLGADAGVRLMSACVEQQLKGELLLLRCQLPAAQQCAGRWCRSAAAVVSNRGATVGHV